MRKPWKMLTEAQKERRRESFKKYRQTPAAKAKQLERKRRWNAKNKDRKNAYNREWYARHKDDTEWMADKMAIKNAWRENNRERYLSKQKAWRDKNYNAIKAKHRHYYKIWRKMNRDKISAYSKKYYSSHSEDILAYQKRYRLTHDTWIMRKLIFALSPEIYARYRRRSREYYARKMFLEGKIYKPAINRRIPDWMPYGVCSSVASRSSFIYENNEKERQIELKAYARDMDIENRNWREGCVR